jgi:short-subunit dehydrogenase
MADPATTTPSKVAFITGASSGFGEGLALRFAERGYDVGLSARRVERLEALSERVMALGQEARVYPCDVADRDALLAAIRQCEEDLGPIDLMIANAGVSQYVTADGLDGREVERIMAINFLGTVTAAEGVLPGMLARGRGQIVAMSSLASFQGLPNHGTYSASKAAINAFFEGLRLDVASRGVDVTIINPGFVKTEMTADRKHPMPFLMDLDPALDIMVKGIRKRRRMIRYPFPLSTVTWWARILPRAWYDRLVTKILVRREVGDQ